MKNLLHVIYGWSLAGEERGGFDAVLDGLVVEPEALRRVVGGSHSLVAEVGPGDGAAVPVPHLATLGAAEHVVRLLRVELNLVDGLLVPLQDGETPFSIWIGILVPK